MIEVRRHRVHPGGGAAIATPREALSFGRVLRASREHRLGVVGMACRVVHSVRCRSGLGVSATKSGLIVTMLAAESADERAWLSFVISESCSVFVDIFGSSAKKKKKR